MGWGVESALEWDETGWEEKYSPGVNVIVALVLRVGAGAGRGWDGLGWDGMGGAERWGTGELGNEGMRDGGGGVGRLTFWW